MPKYSVTITCTIEGDDPDLAYLDNCSKKKFQTPQDVVNYLNDVLAEELVLESTEIHVDEIKKNKMSRKRVVSK